MKKKLIFITMVAILIGVGMTVTKVMNPLNIGINPLMVVADEKQRTGRLLEISFAYESVALVASSQYAFWIEDMDGSYIDTLYVTRYTAQEGHRRRPNSIPQWVSSAQPSAMRNSEINAISGATPKSGEYVAYWDFTDSSGNLVMDAEYRYFIEASVFHDDTAVYSGVIAMGDERWEEYPRAEYSNPNSEYNEMISDVRIAYYPN